MKKLFSILIITLFVCNGKLYSQNQNTSPDSIINLLVGSWDITEQCGGLIIGGGCLVYNPPRHVIITRVSGSSDRITWIEYNGNVCSSASSDEVLVSFPSWIVSCFGGWNLNSDNWMCDRVLRFPITDTLYLDAGCYDCTNFKLVKRAVCTPLSLSQSTTICAGQNFQGCTRTYTTSGTYTDVLNSCQGCDSIVTTHLTVLPVNTYSQSLTICAGQSVNVGTNTHTTDGTYTDTLTAFNSCDSVVTTNLTISTSCPTGIEESSAAIDIAIFPNPTAGLFNIQMTEIGNIATKIYNVMGESIYEHVFISANVQVDLTGKPNGVYFISITTAKGEANRKIVINR